MAVEIASGSSTYFAATGRATLRTIAPVSRSSALAPTDGVSSTRTTGRTAALNRVQSQALVSLSLAVGNGVVQGLKALEQAVEIATHGSLTASYATVQTNGDTRLSTLNIHSQMNLFIGKIDKLVASASIGNANLVSSDGYTVRLQTTKQNGQIDVHVQPLDSKGLNLQNLTLLEDGGIENALGRIRAAILTAGTRRDKLDSLQRFLDDRTVSSQMLSMIGGGYGASTLPRGSLVNLSG